MSANNSFRMCGEPWAIDEQIGLGPLADPVPDRPALHWISLAEVCINSARERLPCPEGREISVRLEEALQALAQLRRQLR